MKQIFVGVIGLKSKQNSDPQHFLGAFSNKKNCEINPRVMLIYGTQLFDHAFEWVFS